MFEFPTRWDLFAQEVSLIFEEGGDYEKYCALTPEAWIQKVLEIQELLAENIQETINKANLQFELGILLFAAKEYEAVVAAYDKLLDIKPNDHEAWYNRGVALVNLERFEEAVASYDQALEIKPDKPRSLEQSRLWATLLRKI